MKRVGFLIVAIFTTLFIISCEPEKEDYTDEWVGNWQTMQETNFPQSKYLHIGTITKDESTRNQIILSGGLLSLSPSYKIPVKISSELRGSIDYTNGFTIKGTALHDSKDTIVLRMNISQNNATTYDTITLTRRK